MGAGRCAGPGRILPILSEAARLFSSGFENVPELITKQAQDLRDAGKSVQKLVEDLAELEAAQLWQKPRRKLACASSDACLKSTEGKKAKLIAHAVGKQAGAIALIGVKGTPTALFFSQSRVGRRTSSDVMKQTLAKFGGKGGGTRDFAQGGGLPEDQLEASVEFRGELVALKLPRKLGGDSPGVLYFQVPLFAMGA